MINLTPGKIYHHTDITKAFDGQNEGGMRKSNTTKDVLIEAESGPVD